MTKKIVLAYSGGLDTSVILKWLQIKYQCPIVTFTADLGQGEELETIRGKAESLGVSEIYIEDLKEEFVRDYIFPMFRANALYEGNYLLGTAIARPLIAKRQIEIARKVEADAVAHGATVIEKHFTLRRKDGGVDSAFSMEPEEMKQLVIETERAWQSMGIVKYGPTEAEKSSMQYRRSLYITQDMKAGDALTPKNLRSIRPGMGLHPKYYDMLLGKKVNQDVIKGTSVSWEILEVRMKIGKEFR